VNYLEFADIDTVTTGAGAVTANTFTDGLYVNGTLLPLNQFHFHSPSEHTINGAHYPLEMHMVHKLFQASADNTTVVPANTAGAVLKSAAVIGVMFAYECVSTVSFAPARFVLTSPRVRLPPAAPSTLMAPSWPS
jgi:hypothetical protein